MDLELFKRYKAAEGSEKRRLLNTIVTKEMPLVRTCVRSFTRNFSQYNAADLTQCGSMGLVSAAQQWDPDRGAWRSFAYRWICSAIQQAVPEQSEIRLPRKQNRPLLRRDQVRQVMGIRSRHGREATAEEIGVSPEVMAKWLTPVTGTVLLGDDLVERQGETSGGAHADPNLNLDSLKALGALDPRAQRIVLAFVVEEKTAAEVAKEESLSDTAVLNIRDAALRTMRKELSW